MILFIAPNPDKVEEHEGFMRRVAAIDNLFQDQPKKYFDDLSTITDKVEALNSSRLIYVHSIYQSKKILENYPLLKDKIVTDLHGLVPEEEQLMGHKEASDEMSEVERFVFKNSRYFVAVSNSMKIHFMKKYKLTNNKNWVVLPIFGDHKATKLRTPDGLNVIYAGGAQSWQNIDLMMEAINKTYSWYNFTILTHDLEAFSKLSTRAKSKTIIKSVTSSEVSKYYKPASMGFILRDNIPINNVACPTKLVEYLENGIVPVVLSPNIGDFKELNYKYIMIDDFAKRPVTIDKLNHLANENLKILEQLKALADQGRTDLLKLYEIIDSVILPKEEVELVRKNVQIGEQRQIIETQAEQISNQKKQIEDYAELVKYHQAKLEELLNSRRWKTAQLLAKPLAVKNIRRQK